MISCATPLLHHHYFDPLIQGRINRCFDGVYAKKQTDQATFFQSSVVHFWWPCVNCSLSFLWHLVWSYLLLASYQPVAAWPFPSDFAQRTAVQTTLCKLYRYMCGKIPEEKRLQNYSPVWHQQTCHIQTCGKAQLLKFILSLPLQFALGSQSFLILTFAM